MIYEYALFFVAAEVWFLAWYFLPNAFFYWLFYKHEYFVPHKIQPDGKLRPHQVRNEILRSIRSLTIYSVLATGCFWAYRNGYTMIDDSFVGNGKVILSTIVLMVFYDTWFYWVHRIIHWKPLFRRFHRQHHESLAPTPWATYSFSMFEAVAQCPLWVLCFTFPAHPWAVLLGLFIQNIYDTFGHSGYEFFPNWMLKNKALCAVQATPTHHDHHHRYTRGNFGHYFNFWDWIMGTELTQYKAIRDVPVAEVAMDPLPSETNQRELITPRRRESH